MLNTTQHQKLKDTIKRERLAREDLALAYKNGESYAVISYWILLISSLEEKLDILVNELAEAKNNG
ncbi:MAG: hypothetical protein RSC43_00730 [Clostridia bacterium]